ncbi:MAG: DUF2442 domain-containing protein, partial [Oligoflexia bacterium]|nr:DUF2442 domain-containing protein [Oligoflexia bacterium]
KLYFKNGKTGTADLASYLSSGKIFKELKNINIFKSFKVEYGTLTWLDGKVDMAPEALYEMATNEKINLSKKQIKAQPEKLKSGTKLV